MTLFSDLECPSRSFQLSKTHLYLATLLGVSPLEFRHLWYQKTRVPGLSYDIVWVILRLAVLVQYRLVTDGRKDRQTDGLTHYAAYTALA